MLRALPVELAVIAAIVSVLIVGSFSLGRRRGWDDGYGAMRTTEQVMELPDGVGVPADEVAAVLQGRVEVGAVAA
jgi:hypothetical protein